MKFCLSLKNNYIIEKKVRLMESKIIKAFFDGNLADEVITTPRTKEYTDIDERETAIYNKLRPMLAGEQLKLFDEFVDLYGNRHALISESYYVRGFKFGLRLAVECFDFSDIDENG